MTKQECIQSKWEEAGFVWEEIKDKVDHEGGLRLNHPSFKNSLTGYGEAQSKGLLKGYGFDGDSLMVWNSLLDEIHTNFGWTKIESEDDLPKKADLYLFLIEGGKNGPTKLWFQKGIKMPYVTHWRPIVEIPNPLY